MTQDDVVEVSLLKCNKIDKYNRQDDKYNRQEEMGLLDSLRSYPRAVFYMLGNEFCERFSFYGMKALLLLYFIYELGMTNSQAVFVYHAFVSLAYFSPLLGSIAADNYFGRFRVILWVSVLYVCGHALLSIGAIPYWGNGSMARWSLDGGGLIVIALATGGIKPCVSAFAADQFDESQTKQRAQFFSFFYFAINAGSLLAITVTPILRGRVQCFGSQYCFPLAFGVPGLLMLTAFFFFLAGWKTYKKVPAAKGNVIFSVFGCIGLAGRRRLNALISKGNSGGDEKREHWLDYASPEYAQSLIGGVKSLVAVSILFGPVVLFWALFDQQGSTWVLQARRMDGRVGAITILPDQMNILNPLFVLFLVPIFEGILYPSLRRMRLAVTPLRKMAVGGILAAVAFVMAGLVQLEVNKSIEPMPLPGHVYLTTIGTSSRPFHIDAQPLLSGARIEIPSGNYSIDSSKEQADLSLAMPDRGFVLGLFQKNDGRNVTTTGTALFSYRVEKTENGYIRVFFLLSPSLNNSDKKPMLYLLDSNGQLHSQMTMSTGDSLLIKPHFISSPDYTLVFGDSNMENTNCNISNCPHRLPLHAVMGSVYVLFVPDSSSSFDQHPVLHQLVRENSVSILWQVPQFLIITIGEVLFSVTGLEFSYSQAAPNMKSVLQALWLMTVFLGNMIDILISGSHIVPEPASEFFVYALLMFAVLGLFIGLSMRYTYVEQLEEEEKEEDPLHHTTKKSSSGERRTKTSRRDEDGEVKMTSL